MAWPWPSGRCLLLRQFWTLDFLIPSKHSTISLIFLWNYDKRFENSPQSRIIAPINSNPGLKELELNQMAGNLTIWRNRITSPCYPNGLFHTCHESRHIALHSKVYTISSQLTEKCNIPRRFYYNVDNDIMWMKGDPLRKTTSAGNYHKYCYWREKFFSEKLPQERRANVWPAEVSYASEFFRTMPLDETFAVKKVYLVYSHADQEDMAMKVFENFKSCYVSEWEEKDKEVVNEILILKNITGRLWTRPVFEVKLLCSPTYLKTHNDIGGNISFWDSHLALHNYCWRSYRTEHSRYLAGSSQI